jgi:hypothetical protein
MQNLISARVGMGALTERRARNIDDFCSQNIPAAL